MKLRDFILMDDGRIGLIVANDLQCGVFRGHADIWFGEIAAGAPIVVQLPVSRMTPLPRPIGTDEQKGAK